MSRERDPRDPRIWDRPENVRRLLWIFGAACVLVFLLDAVFHRHSPFKDGVAPFEQGFGFYSIYGFVACVLLVLVAKQIRRLVMRGEDYWGESQPEDPPVGLVRVEPPGGPPGHGAHETDDAPDNDGEADG